MPINKLGDAARLHFLNSSSLYVFDLIQKLYLDSQALITFSRKFYGIAATIRATSTSGKMPRKRIIAASPATVICCHKSDDWPSEDGEMATDGSSTKIVFSTIR